MGVKLKFNLLKKGKGIRIKPDKTLSDLKEFRESVNLKRQMRGLSNWIYDPIGMASPLYYQIKVINQVKSPVTRQK